MLHTTVDLHAKASSFHAFDPRTKILSIGGFVVCVALLQDPLYLYFSLSFILCMLALSGASWSHIGRQYLLALPFILFSSLSLYFTAGMTQSIAMFLRVSTGVLAVIFLTVSTRFFDLLDGLQKFRVPGLVITLLLLTHRYIFVFLDELDRMKQARRAKAYYGGSHLFNKRHMGMLANTAGMMLVRAYERGLRVQASLRSRGFDGTIKTLSESRFSWLDCGFTGAFLCMAAVLVLLEYGVLAP